MNLHNWGWKPDNFNQFFQQAGRYFDILGNMLFLSYPKFDVKIDTTLMSVWYCKANSHLA